MSRVTMIEEYGGYKVGATPDLVPFLADDYINRKLAKPFSDTKEKDEKIAQLQAENDLLRKKLATKQVDAAPKNKAMGVDKSK